jgi:pantoate--beta-alanine ligase
MHIIHTIAQLRSELGSTTPNGKSIGVVPTMGALHDGHISLLQSAREQCDVVVMTLFVNPTQFNDPADFLKYPRDVARDSLIAENAGVDFIFAPAPDEMYAQGFDTVVSVPGLSNILEGASRPGHFDGVATVVTKLLNIVRADRAYFGQKDYQQLQVVKRLSADLNIGTEIVACPTVREPDGLAMSSRNVRLTPGQRRAAVVLSKALFEARKSMQAGEMDAVKLAGAIAKTVSDEPLAKLDYAVIVDPENLKPLTTIDLTNRAVALIAAKFGDVRLIDNIELFR